MDLVLSKLEKDAFTVFKLFQNKYLKVNSKKPCPLTRPHNFLHIDVGRGQLSNRKYEELLGILLGHKWTFQDPLLKIVQKINQKIHILAITSKSMPQKKLRSTMKALVTICILPTNLDIS